MSIKDKYRVTSIKSSLCKEWLLYKHYAHRIPSISYAFGLYLDAELYGVLTVGKPASYTLCNGVLGSEYSSIVYELNRLVIRDNKEKNLLSFFVATSLRLLPTPLCLVSYADSNQNHTGYIYQATNWMYSGLSSVEKKYLMDNGATIFTRRHIDKKGVIVSTEKQKPKHRYIYFCGDKRQVKEMRSNLKYPILPYPKGDNKRYDTSYQPLQQSELFA